tara:strand:- start:411 stop:536 length:126 start_codon:yes stop_codon:yes gene_type:complete
LNFLIIEIKYTIKRAVIIKKEMDNIVEVIPGIEGFENSKKE